MQFIVYFSTEARKSRAINITTATRTCIYVLEQRNNRSINAQYSIGKVFCSCVKQACLRCCTYCFSHLPASTPLFKVNNKNTRKRCEIRSRLTIKTLERHQWRRSEFFIFNFEHISHLLLVFSCWLWTVKCLLGCWKFYLMQTIIFSSYLSYKISQWTKQIKQIQQK